MSQHKVGCYTYYICSPQFIATVSCTRKKKSKQDDSHAVDSILTKESSQEKRRTIR